MIVIIQVLKITKVSKDGGAKKYTNKGSRENVRQGTPYSSFSSNCVYIVRDAPCLTFSLLPLFVYFFAPPSLLTFVVFILVTVTFIRSSRLKVLYYEWEECNSTKA